MKPPFLGRSRTAPRIFPSPVPGRAPPRGPRRPRSHLRRGRAPRWNEPARAPRGRAAGRDGANAGSRPFTFGELQLQLGQPGPHLQGQRHALEAAVRHARAAEMGSALLPLSPFVRSRKGARENGGAAPDAKVLRRRLSGACTGEAVRAGDGARREGMRRFLLSSPLLLLLPRRFLQRGPAMAAPAAAAAARSRSLRIGSRRARPAAAAPPAPRLCPPARRAPAPARCSPPASGWRRRLALRCRCRDCCRPGTALLSHPRDRAAPRPRPRPPGGAPGPAAPTAAKAPRGAPRSAAERAPRGPRGRSRSGRPLGASPRPAAPLWRRFAYPPRLQVGDLGAFDRLFIPPALPGSRSAVPALLERGGLRGTDRSGPGCHSPSEGPTAFTDSKCRFLPHLVSNFLHAGFSSTLCTLIYGNSDVQIRKAPMQDLIRGERDPTVLKRNTSNAAPRPCSAPALTMGKPACED